MSERYGLMMNIDINSVVTPFLNSISEKEDFKREDLYPFVDRYANTQITDIIFDIFCQYSATDTAFWSTYKDLYLRTQENGFEVDYRERYRGIYKLNTEYAADPYEVWISRTGELGLRPWISVRMNDCHQPEPGEPDAYFIRSDFFYEARKNGWLIGDKYGYFRLCYDYAVPEVREKMLSYIAEQLDKYDVFGLELDFQREIYCFDYINNPNCREIMTQFIRDTRALVNAAGEKWGHGIKLGVRLGRDIEKNRLFGFDALAWDGEKLVDLIVVTPRWASCDDDMPIDSWVNALENTDIQAGVEVSVNRKWTEKGAHGTYITAEIIRSLAAKYLSRGSNGIYLFNFFYNHIHTVDDGFTSDMNAEFADIYNTCGALDTALSKPMRYMLMHEDIVPAGTEAYDPLPITLPASGEEVALKLDLGVLPTGYSAVLTLGLTGGDCGDVKVTANGEAVALENGDITGEEYFCEAGAQLIRGKIGVSRNAVYSLLLSAASGKELRVVHAEIKIVPET